MHFSACTSSAPRFLNCSAQRKRDRIERCCSCTKDRSLPHKKGCERIAAIHTRGPFRLYGRTKGSYNGKWNGDAWKEATGEVTRLWQPRCNPLHWVRPRMFRLARQSLGVFRDMVSLYQCHDQLLGQTSQNPFVRYFDQVIASYLEQDSLLALSIFSHNSCKDVACIVLALNHIANPGIPCVIECPLVELQLLHPNPLWSMKFAHEIVACFTISVSIKLRQHTSMCGTCRVISPHTLWSRALEAGPLNQATVIAFLVISFESHQWRHTRLSRALSMDDSPITFSSPVLVSLTTEVSGTYRAQRR